MVDICPRLTPTLSNLIDTAFSSLPPSFAEHLFARVLADRSNDIQSRHRQLSRDIAKHLVDFDETIVTTMSRTNRSSNDGSHYQLSTSFRKLVALGQKIGHYHYKPLPNDRSFRLMTLLPGKGDDKIRYRLRFAEWTNPPQYEAISYVWGDALDTVQCECDNRRFYLTRNLHRALLQFRFTERERVLWADAVW
jgi:Heterokaryon incompatibility protein (HET)